MSDFNPYAPPEATEDPAPEDEFPWYTSANAIYVRDGTELPAIDLESGESGDHLIPLSRKISKQSRIALISITTASAIVPCLMQAYSGERGFSWRILLAVFVVSGLVRILFHLFGPKNWNRSITVNVFTGSNMMRQRLGLGRLKIRLSEVDENWIRIGNVHPDSIQQLKAIEAQRISQQKLPSRTEQLGSLKSEALDLTRRSK